MLKNVGQTEAVIESIEQRMASNDFSDKAQSALVYSYAITIDPHGIDKNSLVAFRRRLTDQEMVEIVYTINLFRSIIEMTHALSSHP